MQSPAIAGPNRPVLIIANNEIIGRCLVRFIENDKSVSVIQYVNASLDKNITPLLVKVQNLQMSTERHLLINIDSATGSYIGCDSRSSITDELNSVFKDISFVDERRLYLGLAPNFFRSVSGFGKDAPLSTAQV